MRTKPQSLIGCPVDEKAYRVDLELQDRYTAYSAEILRLALLGIGGYGLTSFLPSMHLHRFCRGFTRSGIS